MFTMIILLSNCNLNDLNCFFRIATTNAQLNMMHLILNYENIAISKNGNQLNKIKEFGYSINIKLKNIRFIN